jgi:hypothetical protein
MSGLNFVLFKGQTNFFFRLFFFVAKLLKATVSFVVSICPSVRPLEELGSHWTNFYEILYLSVSRKYINNLPV